MRLTCRANKKAVRQTISAANEPDLFWGMRGAGGNLGVAIEYTTHTFEIPDNVRITAPSLLCCTELIHLERKCNGQSLTLQMSRHLEECLSVHVRASRDCVWQGVACALQTLLC